MPEANELNAVSALAEDDVWAVGTSGSVPEHYTAYRTLIMHWDGRQWTVVPSPTPRPSELLAVDAVSAEDVWAVGRQSSGIRWHPLILHWDGRGWSVVDAPADSDLELHAVAGVAKGAAWAVGGGKASPLIRWDGRAWRSVALPVGGRGRFTSLWTISALSARNAWAAGESGTVVRWNGRKWASVRTPFNLDDVGNGTPGIADIAAVTPNDVWALGSNGSSGQRMHWNGRVWTSRRGVALIALDAASGRDIWAIESGGSTASRMRHYSCS